MFLWIRGKMGRIISRLTGNGNVSAYFDGNDLLWKKLHGDQLKPEDWCW